MFEISPNFSFLKVTDLAELGTLAEKYYQSDPNTSLIKCRQFAEVCAKYISAKIGIYEEVKKEKLIFIINKLRNKKAIKDRIYYLFNDVRNIANSEVHLDPEHSTSINSENKNKVNSDTALKCIKKIHKIANWFHKTYYVNPNIPYKEKEYVIPQSQDDLMKQLQAQLEELNKQNEELKARQIQAEIEQSQIQLHQEEQEVNDRIQSSDFDRELTRISQETMLKPDIIQANIRRGEEMDRETVLISGESVESVEPNRLSSGQILDNRYEIIDELSSGSFGTTYTAYDLKKPNKPICVVKQFTPKQSNEGTFSKASSLFYQEAETLEKLGSHPEIPQLFTYYEENNNLFLVQEYVEGNTLRDELDDQWQEKSVIQLLKDTLTPLVFVHQNNIVHRDIKPENLIRRVGDNKIVIIDFGAVKQVLLQEGSKQGTIIGTKGYMSPEQLMGNITYACDIYAVGIIAIEALTGRKIPDGLSTKQYLEEVTFISDELKQILIKMTAFSPDDRYGSVNEVLEAIEQWETRDDETPTVINPEPEEEKPDTPSPVIGGEDKDSDEPPPVPWWEKIPKSWLIGGGVGVLVLGGLFIKSLPYLTKTRLEQTELTIGTIWKPEASQGLADYVEENSVPANYFDFLKGEQVKVRINGDRTLSYPEAKTRIETKQWDIAFATSPMLSIFAKDQGYNHLAGMFPGSSSYNAGLFVRSDSPIQSINNINSTTKVALGSFTSASSFYMPVYDLYGKTVIANVGNRGEAIIDKVKNGEADVGSAAIGDSIRKDDPTLRIIHVSRDIPGSGVYASPTLSQKDRDNIQKLMLNAPSEIQKEANYEEKPEPDYTEFRKIVERVEEILICSDFSKNPVTLACTGDIQTIEGKINGVSIEGDNSILKVSANGQIYNILIPANMKIDIFGSDKLTDIQGKSIIVKTNEIKDNNVKINQITQIKVN